MTLSRFLRDFLYIPLGGNRKGKVRTVHQPVPDDAPRRPVARSGVDVRVVGRVPRCRLGRRARAGRTAVKRVPVWLRWFITFHLVVFGWILFRSQSLDLAGQFISRCSCPARRRCGAFRWLLAILVVIGLQLLPAKGVEGFQARIERIQPVVLGVGLAVVVALRARRCPRTASPRSSTSASREKCPTTTA
jgi:hypothetical protein